MSAYDPKRTSDAASSATCSLFSRCCDPEKRRRGDHLASTTEVKHLYLTNGDSDLVVFVDAPNGDNVAKFALALGSLGNVRTRTARAWSAEEYVKLISELP